MIFRTPEQKSDLEASFRRADRPFFAAGACHVLAWAFLDSTEKDDWKASLISPHPGFRGTHVFACNSRCAFDYHGFTQLERFLDHYFKKMNRFFPGWSADIIELDVCVTLEDFCASYNHRTPDNFFENPVPRASAFVQRVKRPDES